MHDLAEQYLTPLNSPAEVGGKEIPDFPQPGNTPLAGLANTAPNTSYPLESHFPPDSNYVPAPYYGAVSRDDALASLSGGLGAVLGGAGGAAMDDPRVQAALAETAESCKERAKVGVDEWVYENRQNIALGAVAIVGTLLTGHWILSVAALRLAFPRRAFQERGAQP